MALLAAFNFQTGITKTSNQQLHVVLPYDAAISSWPSLQVPVRHPVNAAVLSNNEDDDVDVSSWPPYAASL